MRHDWVFDVLNDLCSYAQQNELPALAEEVEHALRVARREIGAQGGSGSGSLDSEGDGGLSPADRPH